MWNFLSCKRGIPLHTAFHYHPSIILVWLKSDVKLLVIHPSLSLSFSVKHLPKTLKLDHKNLSFTAEILFQFCCKIGPIHGTFSRKIMVYAVSEGEIIGIKMVTECQVCVHTSQSPSRHVQVKNVNYRCENPSHRFVYISSVCHLKGCDVMATGSEQCNCVRFNLITRVRWDFVFTVHHIYLRYSDTKY